MKKNELIEKIIEANKITQKQLNFWVILKNQKNDLVNKIVDVWVEKYKNKFKINSKEIDYQKYLKYVNNISEYLNKNILEKKNLTNDIILWLNKIIFEQFQDENLKIWKLRKEIRTIENFDKNWKLIQRDMFISPNKVEKYFLDELNNFNNEINKNTFETIIHLFQYNLSKIHPFYNWNGRVFFILLDILLLKYNYLPLFIRQDKNKYEDITRQYMIDKNFKKLEIAFLELILEKYKNYKIK